MITNTKYIIDVYAEVIYMGDKFNFNVTKQTISNNSSITQTLNKWSKKKVTLINKRTK